MLWTKSLFFLEFSYNTEIIVYNTFRLIFSKFELWINAYLESYKAGPTGAKKGKNRYLVFSFPIEAIA